jgi:inosine-uridine nucleoside N-ribohydrolase
MPTIHLDTDFGGDIDDLCALALLLAWPGADVRAVTTNTEDQGVRAGYARYVLDLAGRSGVPVAAGADRSLGCFRLPAHGSLVPDEGRYWPEPIASRPGDLSAALDLLEESIAQGAVIVAIGSCTNLALLEARSPGILRQARLVLMGGFVERPRPGFPSWDHTTDWNFQVDVDSARRVLAASMPTLVPIAVTAETALRGADLERLRTGGPVARIIARQAEAFAIDENLAARYLPDCSALPADFINFQHDPLAVAIALGWDDGLQVEEVRLRNTIEEGWLVQTPSPEGDLVRLVTRIDGPAFGRLWLDAVAP